MSIHFGDRPGSIRNVVPPGRPADACGLVWTTGVSLNVYRHDAARTLNVGPLRPPWIDSTTPPSPSRSLAAAFGGATGRACHRLNPITAASPRAATRHATVF